MLRAAAAGAVCVALAACTAEGELSGWFAAGAAALVCAGGIFSYWRRSRPLPYLKVFLSAAMVGAFVWFFVTVSKEAAAGQLSAVETPLAALFGAMQAAHAFDMPSRRDLGFSIAGSSTLIAVAGAQAIDLSFAVYVALWAAFALAGLHATWSSMTGGRAPRPVAVLTSTAAALTVASLLVAFLPTPQAPSFSFSPDLGATGSGAVGQPSRVVPAARTAASGPASASGPTGVGGYLGFAGPLDTALRPGLGNEVVLRVRADRPTYWVAETYDSWSGRSWTAPRRSPPPGGTRPDGAPAGPWTALSGGSPFVVTPSDVPLAPAGNGVTRSDAADGSSGAQPDYQTFYLAAPASNLVLHADQATAVWLPTPRIYVSADGTILTGRALGPGSVYSVLSTVDTPGDRALATANGTPGLTASLRRQDLELPYAYPRVAALARRVTAGHATVVSKVVALEHWIGAHTVYTLDVPPLARGQDAVNQFLFGSRRGFCEQISTSLAVMLRTLGIPAREAVGYVPGRFDPLAGLYDEQAKDAHAWVQVWFPGFGWQSFDPTTYVPKATPSTASTMGQILAAVLRRVPAVPVVAGAAALVLGVAALVWRRRRPRTWRARVTRELERAARRAGIPPAPGATLCALAAALDDALDDALGDAPPDGARGDAPGRWHGLAHAEAADSESADSGVPESSPSPATPGSCRRAAELAWAATDAAWGGRDVPRRTGRRYVLAARHLRRRARHHARRHAAARGAVRADVSSWP